MQKEPNLSKNVTQYSSLEEIKTLFDCTYLKVAIQAAHNLTGKHQMVIMNPDEVLWTTVTCSINTELIVHSHIGTPVFAKNLKIPRLVRLQLTATFTVEILGN